MSCKSYKYKYNHVFVLCPVDISTSHSNVLRNSIWHCELIYVQVHSTSMCRMPRPVIPEQLKKHYQGTCCQAVAHTCKVLGANISTAHSAAAQRLMCWWYTVHDVQVHTSMTHVMCRWLAAGTCDTCMQHARCLGMGSSLDMCSLFATRI